MLADEGGCRPPSSCYLATLVGAFAVRPLAALLMFFVSSIFVAALTRFSLRLAATLRPADRLAAAIVSTVHRLVAAVRMGLAIVRGSDGIVYVRCPGIGSLGRRWGTWNVVPDR